MEKFKAETESAIKKTAMIVRYLPEEASDYQLENIFKPSVARIYL